MYACTQLTLAVETHSGVADDNDNDYDGDEDDKAIFIWNHIYTSFLTHCGASRPISARACQTAFTQPHPNFRSIGNNIRRRKEHATV